MSFTDKGLPIKAPDFYRKFLGERVYTGNVFFVDSSKANAAPRRFRDKSGRTPESAMPTLADAISKATANNDDVIFVMPNHTENSPSENGINVNKAGLSIVGVTQNGLRPSITIGTASVTASSVTVTAADVTIANLDFVAAIDSLAAPFTVPTAADRLKIFGCRFYLGSGVTTAPTLWITLNANADDFRFESNQMSNTVGITNSPAGFIDFMSDPAWNYLPVYIDGTVAAHNTAAIHSIVDVTGPVEMRILPLCLTDLTSGGSATLTLGYDGDEDAYVGSTAFDDLNAGTAWLATTPPITWANTAVIHRWLSNEELVYEIGTAALNGGTMRVYIAWKQGPTQSLALPSDFGAV